MNGSICKAVGCERKSYARGFCIMHYYRLLRFGRVHRIRESHGMWGTPEYKIWTAMKQRCSNSKCPEYKNYGARGISVCARWNSFTVFISDIGRRPSPNHQIDRIDNNGNYEPQNCRWATSAENSQNKRNTRLSMKKAQQIRKIYAMGGVSQRAIAQQYGVSHGAVEQILLNKAWQKKGFALVEAS